MSTKNLKLFLIVFIPFSVSFLTYAIIFFKKDIERHKEWTKTIKAPFDGHFTLYHEFPKCHVDSVMGDSVRIITVIKKENIYENDK